MAKLGEKAANLIGSSYLLYRLNRTQGAFQGIIGYYTRRYYERLTMFHEARRAEEGLPWEELQFWDYVGRRERYIGHAVQEIDRELAGFAGELAKVMKSGDER